MMNPRAASLQVPPNDMRVLRRTCKYLGPISRRYFRSDIRAMDRLPAEQSIIVANHDGGVLPMNGLCFGDAWHQHYGFTRPLYVLTHDFLHQLGKSFSNLLLDSGIIPADRAHMNAALATGESVLVFPGSSRETFRPFWQRKKIDLGGRTGFVAQAIRWNLPITPVVSAGSHETLFVLASGEKLARKLHLRKIVKSADNWPILAGLPWGIWAMPFLPQLPLPAKITVEVLEPIRLADVLGRRLHADDASDKALVDEGFRYVLDTMQAAIDRLYAERRWPVLG